MGLREDKKRETRHAIVDTSLSLFRQYGFDRTRVQDVTALLRISEGTFFNYFPTKHAVLEAAGGDLIDRAIEALVADTDHAILPVPERLLTTVTAFARNFETDREFAALLAAHTTFFSSARAERLQRVHALLTDLFTEGQHRSELRDDIPAVQLADAFLAVVTAMVHGWAADTGPIEPLESRLVKAASVLLHGCQIGGVAAGATFASARSRPEG